jgi:hypothetical protein
MPALPALLALAVSDKANPNKAVQQMVRLIMSAEIMLSRLIQSISTALKTQSSTDSVLDVHVRLETKSEPDRGSDRPKFKTAETVTAF